MSTKKEIREKVIKFMGKITLFKKKNKIVTVYKPLRMM